MHQLPALIIEVTGSVSASNLAEYRAAATTVIDSINMELKTDEDFVQAKSDIEWFQGVEEKVKSAIENILSSSKPVADVVEVLRSLGVQSAQKRLELAKAVKDQEESRRADIATRATDSARQRINDINKGFERPFLNMQLPDFRAAMKGKRTLATTQAAVDAVLLAFIQQADQSAERIRTNLAAIRRKEGMAILFPDLAALVCKSVDEVEAIVTARIQQHEAHEALRLQQERERAAQAAQQLATQAAQQAAAEERAKLAAQQPPAPAPTVAPTVQPVAIPARPTVGRNASHYAPLAAEPSAKQPAKTEHAHQAPPAEQQSDQPGELFGPRDDDATITWQVFEEGVADTFEAQPDDSGLWTILHNAVPIAKTRFSRDIAWADQIGLVKKMIAANALLSSVSALISCAEPARDRAEIRRARQVLRFLE